MLQFASRPELNHPSSGNPVLALFGLFGIASDFGFARDHLQNTKSPELDLLVTAESLRDGFDKMLNRGPSRLHRDAVFFAEDDSQVVPGKALVSQGPADQVLLFSF